MTTGDRLFGELPKAREYDWIDSYIGRRADSASDPGDPEFQGVIVESALLRTIFFTILLGVLGCLMAYLSMRVVAGQGRSAFQLMAALAAFLTCAAIASWRSRLLRFLLVLGSLSVLALLVDQMVYQRWNQRAERLLSSLQQSVDSGALLSPDQVDLRPTSFSIDPGREILLVFEPPILAWMYRLDSASPVGHALISGSYRILSKATRGRDLDAIARTLVRPHVAYTVRLTSDEGAPACQEAGKGDWTLSIDRRRGARPI
jgi:hypothetical protein